MSGFKVISETQFGNQSAIKLVHKSQHRVLGVRNGTKALNSYQTSDVNHEKFISQPDSENRFRSAKPATLAQGCGGGTITRVNVRSKQPQT